MHPSPRLHINAGPNQSNVTSPGPNGPKCRLPQVFVSTIASKAAQDGELQDQTASACTASFRRFLIRLRRPSTELMIGVVAETHVQRRLRVIRMSPDAIP